MNIPISWLKEAAQITDTTQNLLTKLTDAGNAVETITHLGADISNVIVGRVESLTRHPDADKLWITQTNVGKETLQIITGADNLKVGDLVPVAIHGSTIAGGVKIKKGKMRGLDSNGMLCSISELGYTVADYPEACEEGIYVIPTELEAELGADVRPIMGLLEDVADFDILSNRPDTNAIIGMAREAAAVYGNTFAMPAIELEEKGEGSAADLIQVAIENPALCPRYIARVVKNVKIGPSPQWLRRRLSTAGIRPINNIVDITNYVMLEYGQPLHAFDIRAVAEGKIVVRTAQEGETITTLDGEERKLDKNTLLIADPTKALGIAGVMGGENSKINDDTTTILFESANFDTANIRQTSRNLGLRTDASARYEKGQDPNQAMISVNRAMELVELLGAGEVVPGVVDNYPTPREPRTIDFDPAAICKLLGINITEAEICAYLARVGITASGGKATLPTYRADIAGNADLAEEVARFYGLNNIESRTVQALAGHLPSHKAGKTPRRQRQDRLKQAATALGYNEALTYPFESPKVLDKLQVPADHPLRTSVVTLKNPLGEDFSVMRTTTLGAIVESLARNYNKGNENVALFEVSSTFSTTDVDNMEVINRQTVDTVENQHLTLATYGENLDFLAIKGDVESLIGTITNRPMVFTPLADLPFMHPGRTATIGVKTSPNPRDAALEVGFVGELHPQVAKNFNIGARVYVAVFHMEVIHNVAEAYKLKFKNPATFPPLSRDLAFKVPENVPAADIEAAIVEKAGQYFSEIKLFDVYQGEQVGAGFKSMAYALKFRAPDKTLSVPDVENSLNAILDNLKKKHGAEIRG